MLLYSSSLGLRASAWAWIGDLGGAESDAVTALALLPADDPIIRPASLSALTDVHIERGTHGGSVLRSRSAKPSACGRCSLRAGRSLSRRGRRWMSWPGPSSGWRTPEC